MGHPSVPFELGELQTTLVLPLWGRAREAQKKDPIILDTYAREIVDRIGYDFSKIKETLTESLQMTWAIRAYNFDATIRTFLASHKDALVVNIGAGLDTTFQRIDNGTVRWVNIDLPDVVSLRQKLVPDSERELTIGKSVFDYTWMDDISTQAKGRALMLIAAGVLFYFDKNQLKNLFRKLADTYPSGHLVFDSFSRLSLWMANRAVIKKTGIHSSSLMKWHLKRASRLRRWVETINVVEEYPAYSKIEIRQGWGEKMIRQMRQADRLRLYNMIHVQFQ